MHTGIAALDVEESLQFAFPCIQKRLLPLRIKRSHLPNMPGEVPLANKVGKRRLFNMGDWRRPCWRSPTRRVSGSTSMSFQVGIDAKA